jgi:hypothetical protein
MTEWTEPAPPPAAAGHCALCDRLLYVEEMREAYLPVNSSFWHPLCGACRRRSALASEQNIMAHFAARLRQRGHTVKVLVDGREI